MKTNERLFHAIGDIDPKLVTAAAPGRGKQNNPMKKWLPAVACLAVAATVGIAAWRANTTESVERRQPENGFTYNTVEELGSEQATQIEMATGVVPHWDEMAICQQFAEFTVNGARYSSRSTAIDAGKVGQRLGEATSQGYDIYTDTTHTSALTYYAVEGLSTDCVLAAQFEGDDSYYVYVNSWYRPATLGELIDALNLRENMTFGDFHAAGFNDDGDYETVRFVDPDDSIVWEQLLSDTTLENVYSETGWYGSILSFSVNIPLLGYENISLWLTEDGHLVTNILDTGKAFYIGQERVAEILYYVVMHCPDREVTVIHSNRDAVVTAEDGDGGIVEMTTSRSASTPAYDPSAAQTAAAQDTLAPETRAPKTTAAPAYSPESSVSAAVTSQAYNPQITTSEE